MIVRLVTVPTFLCVIGNVIAQLSDKLCPCAITCNPPSAAKDALINRRDYDRILKPAAAHQAQSRSPLLPRTQPLCQPKPFLSAPSCGIGPSGKVAAIVRPAIMQTLPCGLTAAVLEQQQRQQQLLTNGNANQQTLCSLKTVPNYQQRAPADPVSLSLAFRKAQRHNNAREKKLWFGFSTLPREINRKKECPCERDFEASLYQHNGPILELASFNEEHKPNDLSKEAEEDLLELAEEEAEERAKTNAQNDLRRVSLAQLGYSPVQGMQKTCKCAHQLQYSTPSSEAPPVQAKTPEEINNKPCVQDGSVPGTTEHQPVPQVGPNMDTSSSLCSVVENKEKVLPVYKFDGGSGKVETGKLPGVLEKILEDVIKSV